MGEEHWLAGYLYFNRTDRRLVVPWRGGRGYVLNCGRPLGLAVTVLSLGLPLAGLLAIAVAIAWQFRAIGLAIGLPVVLVLWRLAALLAPEERRS